MAEAKQKPQKKIVRLTFAEDFILSGIAAVTSKTIAAPIERVKMVKQTEDEIVKRGQLKEPFKGIGHVFTWIMQNEGPIAFWRSNFTNCLRYFPTQALNFSFKGQIKRIEHFKNKKDDSYPVVLYKNIMGGGLAGGGGPFFVYSLDYARTRLASDMKSSGKDAAERQFTGLLDVYKKTLASDGVVGLYRGFVISFVGIFIYRGFYFGLYDSIMPLVPKENSNLAVRFAVGYAVTVAAGLASYPIDTIRRRMMMTSGGGVKYKGSIDCTKQILAKEGVKSFFKGAGANILRGVAGAGVLSGFDTITDYYVKKVYGPECSLK
jgi:solute carrier family 25 (adenine nucleotide translocator) protein 4/5/6/31